MSIADIARTTKIQARILEDLEAGENEGLPADVFVRGFVRNYARCVGLSEAEALARYAACSRDAGPVASPAATAVAELYAPTTRRMSTVMPVAPGSPAAEVHAHGHRYERAATSPGYPRAATSPGIPQSVGATRQSGLQSGLHAGLTRATTENGELAAEPQPGAYGARRTSTQMAAVYPRPAVGSGLVSTAGVQAAIAAAEAAAVAARAASIPTPPVVAAAMPEPQAPVTRSTPAIPVVEVVDVVASPSAELARPATPEWPRGLSAKKRKSQKRKERNERNARQAHAADEANAQPVTRQRAQTIRPPIESELRDVGEISDVSGLIAARDSQDRAPSAAAQPVAASLAAVVAPVVAPVVASGIAAEAAPVAEPVDVEGWPSAAPLEDASAPASPAIEVAEAAPLIEEVAVAAPAEVWIPKMPAPRPSVSRSFVAPTLTIDDSDPESASREQDDRSSEREGREGRDPTRRTFLPPILLESQDRANRQGGLTLAVIILLIAATLTLSYLMRRPSSGGGGMTSLDAPVTLIG
jgi:Helix-turn-helix domain